MSKPNGSKNLDKIDDRLTYLSGNGNGHDSNGSGKGIKPYEGEPNDLNRMDGKNFWYGCHFISNADWKRIAGYTDLSDLISHEELNAIETGLVNRDPMASEKLHALTKSLKHEIRSQALLYFPAELPPLTVIFNPWYKCPEYPEGLGYFREEYRQLLMKWGIPRSEYDGAFFLGLGDPDSYIS